MAPDPRTRFIAAGFMSFMMCGLMTGWHAFSSLPAAEAPALWGEAFVMSWPVAFVFACLLGPVAGKAAFRLSRALDRRRE